VAEEKDFWTRWKETGLAKLRFVSRDDLHSHYEFFAEQHYALHPETQSRMFRAAQERMESIQREIDRRYKRRTTLVSVFLSVIGLIASVWLGTSSATAGGSEHELQWACFCHEERSRAPGSRIAAAPRQASYCSQSWK
jgi:hypothetical protein